MLNTDVDDEFGEANVLLSQVEPPNPVLLSQDDPSDVTKLITFTGIGCNQNFTVPSQPHNKGIKIGHAMSNDGSIQIYDKARPAQGERQLIH